MSLLENTSIPQDAKLRLAILYALRYQKFGGNQIANIVKKLLEVGVEESRAGVSLRERGLLKFGLSVPRFLCLSSALILFLDLTTVTSR